MYVGLNFVDVDQTGAIEIECLELLRHLVHLLLVRNLDQNVQSGSLEVRCRLVLLKLLENLNIKLINSIWNVFRRVKLLEPLMLKHIRCSQSSLRVLNEHLANEVLAIIRNHFEGLMVHLELSSCNLGEKFILILSGEGHVTTHNRVQ